MKKASPCPECGSTHLYRSPMVNSAGGYGPQLLPGLGGLFRQAKFRLVVCSECGLTRFFVVGEALDKLTQSNRWERLS